MEVGLKNDIELLRKDTKGMEVNLRHDMKEMELSLKHDMKEMDVKFDGKFKLLNWMMTFVLAGLASLILKAFFVHP